MKLYKFVSIIFENTRATVIDYLFFDLDILSNRRIKRSARSSQKARAQIETKHRRDENARLFRFFEEHTARQKTQTTKKKTTRQRAQTTKKKRVREKKKATRRLIHVEEIRRVEQARFVETATVIVERQRLKREEQEKKRRQINRELIEQKKI